MKAGEDAEAFSVAGTAGAVMNNIMPAIQNNTLVSMKTNLGLDENAFHAAWIMGEDGVYHGVNGIKYWTSVVFNPDIDDEKFERVMDMMEYSVTPEAQQFIRMGFEGVDWAYDVNGEKINLIPDGKSVLQQYASNVPVYCNILVLSDDFGFINPAFPKEFRDLNVKYFKQRYEMSTPETLVERDWVAYFHASPAMNRIPCDYATEYAQIILKDGDLEANWNSWVADKMAMVQPVLDELNAKIGK
jgi:putative aldouronate transport system substrate-binding protein